MFEMRKLLVLVFACLSFGLMAQNKEVHTYYDNGGLKSTYRYTSAQYYEVINYYPSGRIMETGRFVNGKMHGTWITYSEAGIRSGEASYKNGERSGEWKLYDENGQVRYKALYDANRIVNSVNIDANGNAVAETRTR